MEPDGADRRNLVSVVEALLYAAEDPVSTESLAAVIQEAAPESEPGLAERADPQAVERACVALKRRYLETGSALQVVEVAGGFRLGTRPAYDVWIRALRRAEKPAQLSQAALETLAVVAYRQPVTAAEVGAIRGVDPSATLRTLRELGLVRVAGRKRTVGRPFTYATTRRFLIAFGLRDLDELPSPEEFEELLEA